MSVPLAVTVTAKRPGRHLVYAKAKAIEWGLPFVSRTEKVLLSAQLEAQADAFLVLGGDGWTLHDAQGELFFSPGLAAVRIKRLQQGQEQDVVVRLGEVARGDSVLDCTLGLGADALVCARAVGPSGRVVGVEASLPLYALASEGLRGGPLFDDSASIEVRHQEALAVLRELPSGSFDCVILDPMFDLPKRSSPSFEMLRRYARHVPLDKATVSEAQRVARRWVVLKGGRYGTEFTRLGLTPLRLTRSSPVLWARLPGFDHNQ